MEVVGMGFGESAAHIILFIAVVIVASSLSVMMATTVQRIAIGMEQQGNHVQKLLTTDFEIINDPENIPTKTVGTNTAYIFYIKNTGTNSFPLTNSTITVMIDGTLISPVNVTTSPTQLQPGETGEVDVIATIPSGDHTLKIVLYNGIYSTLKFSV
ncbi:MAG: flagellar protein G [Archaeoglobus sp.]|nr:MAG: flagellar protein G [Archaeoglobus sp.]